MTIEIGTNVLKAVDGVCVIGLLWVLGDIVVRCIIAATALGERIIMREPKGRS